MGMAAAEISVDARPVRPTASHTRRSSSARLKLLRFESGRTPEMYRACVLKMLSGRSIFEMAAISVCCAITYKLRQKP
jgi:hypothetical protein